MLILVRQKINNEYYTIYREDKQKFLNLEYFFNYGVEDDSEKVQFNFELIEDVNDIKKILEDNFTSKGRGDEYNPDLPSVTRIAYGLYPLDINRDKFLIKYINNKVITPEDEKNSNLILQRGTFLHKILELWVSDTECRKKDKPLIEKINILKNTKKPSKQLVTQIEDKIHSYIDKYIKIAYKDKEILYKIPNLDEIKDYLSNLAHNALTHFIYEELINSDLVYSEIFLSIPDYIQGSIDLVAYKDNKFSVIDFKTTQSIDKKTGKPKFKNNSQLEPYSRQLAIYNELLKRANMSHIVNDDLPEFYIYQIHLISNKYKRFEIPKNMIKNSTKEVENILNWYWSIRKGIEYKPNIEENLEYLTL